MQPSRKSRLALALVAALIAWSVATLLLRETPNGRVAGTLVAADTGRALGGIRVSLARDDGARTYDADTDAAGRFRFGRVAAGTYRLSARTSAHEQPRQKIAVREGQSVRRVVELQPSQPFLRVFESQRVFTSRETPKMRVHGFVPVRTMSLRVYALAPDTMLRAWNGALNEALGVRGDIQKANLAGMRALRLAVSKDVPVTRRDMEGVFREEVALGRLNPGMYLLAFQAGAVRALSVVTVTDLGLAVKSAPTELLAFAADIRTGAPLRGVAVNVYQDNRVTHSGVTDANGLLSVPMTAARDRSVQVAARWNASVAIASAYSGGNDDGPMRVYAYTDRPVYRPGHTVHFKAMLRLLQGNRYTVPAGVNADVRVAEPNGDPLYAQTLTTNRFGSLDGTLELHPEARPGPYTLTVAVNGQTHETMFQVAEYRKPEYEVTVEPARRRFSRSETVEATVSAQYYYGAPVAGAEVTYYVTRSPQWYYEDPAAWDADMEETATLEGGGEADGEVMVEGRGETDAAGRMTVRIPPQPAPKDADQDAQDWRYTIRATVTDVSKRAQESTGSVLVTQGDFRLEVSPERYLARPAQPVTVDIRAVDHEGRPVPNARGALELYRRFWDGDTERTADATRQEWRADAEGRATLRVTPGRDGDYRLMATARDDNNATIRQTGGLWVMSGDEATFDYPYQDLEVRAEKRLYREGETARIVVNTRHAGQTALLTVEGDALHARRLVRLAGKSTVLSVPVTARQMPAARVSLCFFRDKQFVTGEAVINISRERKALTVEIATDKPAYQPGETATYTVRTRLPNGRPAPAEVSLGVVDEAVYAIARDDTPNIVAHFYPKRLYWVSTAYSFPNVYLSGDEKSGSNIPTRRNFPDTAFWNPSVVTDAAGRATFQVTLPDNLTTWRATCRAATPDTIVGQATRETVVRKPFLIRLETPRFFTQDDEVEIAGVVHNLTGAGVNATAGLDLNGTPTGRQERESVDNGATHRFAWRVKTPYIGDLKLRVWATAGTYNDAMEMSVPVQPRGRQETQTTSGDVSGAENFALNVRQDVVPGTQRLTVRLSPSVVSAMLGSLDYLATYPYGCVEQTMSAFLPDVVLYRMLSSRQIEAPGLRERLPDMVRGGLLKIAELQNDTGGWGWWRYDGPDTWMTAYVVYGLLEARDAGFSVNQAMLDTGISTLATLARETGKSDVDSRAFAAYVLALAGRAPDARAVAATFAGAAGEARRAKLSDWGRPMLALAMVRTGYPTESRRLLEQAWTAYSPTGFRPREANKWRSSAEYAAAILYAACELTPNDPRLGALARRLMDMRSGDHWASTRDTATALYALSRYAALTRELQPDMEAAVTVNGRVVARRRFSAADLAQPEYSVTVDAGQLPPGPASVAVQMSGQGRLYYSATLEQVAAMDLNAPLQNDSGLTIERHYRVTKASERASDNNRPAPTGAGESTFRSGDVVDVTLTLRATRPYEYVMVEDMLPAGFEARDRGTVDRWEWDNWWVEQVARDERMGFAIRRLEPGAQRITYRMYAQSPGTFTALPARVFDMYNPSARGEGAARSVTIRP